MATNQNASTANDFYKTLEWILGDGAQREWAGIVAKKGNVVLPTYCMGDDTAATKAPLLFTSQGTLVAPDMLLMKPACTPKWHEVKAKSQPSWRRTHRRWEHGCDWYLAKQYVEVSKRSGAPVFIIVHEVQSPENSDADSPLRPANLWLAISLNRAFEVGEHRTDWPGGKMNPRRRGRAGQGGLLWARNSMKVVEPY